MTGAERLPDIRLDRSLPVASLLPPCAGTYRAAARYVESLAYGRNSDAWDWRLVATEKRGTCSTKHALLAVLAEEQGLPCRLALRFFEMSGRTHPLAAVPLRRFGLDSVLEAHCMLLHPAGWADLTGLPTAAEPRFQALWSRLDPDWLALKRRRHRTALARWARQRGLSITPGRLWSAREACIAALEAGPRSEWAAQTGDHSNDGIRDRSAHHHQF